MFFIMFIHTLMLKWFYRNLWYQSITIRFKFDTNLGIGVKKKLLQSNLDFIANTLIS